MLKKTMIIILLLSLIFLLSILANHTKVPLIYIDGTKVHAEVTPQIKSGYTFVPINIIIEQLGCKLIGSESKDKVILEKNGSILKFTLNNHDVDADGLKVTLKVSPFVSDGIIMLPLRFIVEHYELRIVWDSVKGSIDMIRIPAVAIESVKQISPIAALVPMPTLILTLTPKPMPNPTPMPPYKVVIDPGHGGADVGALSVSGRYEKDFNLTMALKIKSLFEKETAIMVYLTRNDNTTVLLNDRIGMANDLTADLYLSIHANIDTTSNAKGTETFYYRDDSKPFAQMIQKHVQKATGFRNRYTNIYDFRVLKNTLMPAALVEVGFLSNEEEDKELFIEKNQDKIAAALVKGIKEFLRVE